jgi:RNA polymerase sigma factor (sigma-70 family)
MVALSALSDAEWIARSWHDAEAFGEVFNRHFRAVFQFAARRVHRDEAEEMAGEVLRRAFEHRRGYDLSKPDARPWLYGIALNVIRHSQRSFVRRSDAFARLDHTHWLVPDHMNAVVDQLDADRLLPVVARAIRRLPPDEMDPLLLHAWEGLTYADIAVALQVPVGTVRSRINRARVRLRRALELSDSSSHDSRPRS